MAISPSFTVSQSGLTPGSFTVTDTSTGDYDTIVARRVYVIDAFGNYLTGNGTINYDSWALANASITLNVLTEDLGVNILVEWIDVVNAIVDSLNNNYPLPEFNQQFLYYLVQQQGLTPGIYQDTNYSGNIAVFWTNIIAGINAVVYGNDIAACQNCFSRATQMRLNQSLYF